MPIPAAVLGVAQGAFSLAQQEQQRYQQRQTSEHQFHRDLMMWDMNNKYNSPQAQMGRLKEAGLNPNLAFGSGSVTGNTSGSIPKYQSFNPEYKSTPVEFGSALDYLNKYQDLKSKAAQTDNILEQNRTIKLENAIKEVNQNYLTQTLQSRVNKASTDSWRSFYDKDIAATKSSWMNDLTMKKKNPIMLQYQMDAQRLMQDQRMNDVDYMLKNIEGIMGKSGISKNEGSFLRAISLMKQGFKEPANMLPYIIGKGAIESLDRKIKFK